jgi:hypothetical protein
MFARNDARCTTIILMGPLALPRKSERPGGGGRGITYSLGGGPGVFVPLYGTLEQGVVAVEVGLGTVVAGGVGTSLLT